MASKAALLFGRRPRNCERIESHVASADPRIRANVAEGSCGVNSALAIHALRKCLLDGSNRAYGNAVVGLRVVGERSVNWHSAN